MRYKFMLPHMTSIICINKSHAEICRFMVYSQLHQPSVNAYWLSHPRSLTTDWLMKYDARGPYPPNTLYQQVCGILHHLRELEHATCINLLVIRLMTYFGYSKSRNTLKQCGTYSRSLQLMSISCGQVIVLGDHNHSWIPWSLCMDYMYFANF